MYYVSMIDTFMSGWGKAKGKENVLIFECETEEEAEIVVENARHRSDQKDIKICDAMPAFASSYYYVQYKDKSVYPSWYEKDCFKEEE